MQSTTVEYKKKKNIDSSFLKLVRNCSWDYIFNGELMEVTRMLNYHVELSCNSSSCISDLYL